MTTHQRSRTPHSVTSPPGTLAQGVPRPARRGAEVEVEGGPGLPSEALASISLEEAVGPGPAAEPASAESGAGVGVPRAQAGPPPLYPGSAPPVGGIPSAPTRPVTAARPAPPGVVASPLATRGGPAPVLGGGLVPDGASLAPTIDVDALPAGASPALSFGGDVTLDAAIAALVVQAESAHVVRRSGVEAAAAAARATLAAGCAEQLGRLQLGRSQHLMRLRERSAAARAIVQASVSERSQQIDGCADVERQRISARVDKGRVEAQTAAEGLVASLVAGASSRASEVTSGVAAAVGAVSSRAEALRSSYGGGEQTGDIASEAREATRRLVEQSQGRAASLAAVFREEAAQAAAQIRADVGSLAGEFLGLGVEAQAVVEARRVETQAQLQRAAVETLRLIDAHESETVTAVDVAIGAEEGTLQVRRAEAEGQIERGRVQALAGLDEGHALAQAQLHAAAVTYADVGAAPMSALSVVAAALSEGFAQQQQALDRGGDRAKGALAGAAFQGIAVAAQAVVAVDAKLTAQSQSYAGTLDQLVAKADGEITTLASRFGPSLIDVFEGVDVAIGTALSDATAGWSEQTSGLLGSMDTRAQELLASMSHAGSSFLTSLEGSYSRALSAGRDVVDAVVGFVKSAFEFVKGTVVGFLSAAWSMVKSIGDLLANKWTWIVLALVVVVAVVLVLTGGWALLAVAAKLVLVVLTVAGLLFGLAIAGYALYLMVSQPDLTAFERGELFGQALLELLLSIGGVGMVGRLARSTRLAEIAALIDRVGDAGLVFRLLRYVDDPAQLVALLDAAGDAQRALRLAQRLGSGQRVITLLGRAKDPAALAKFLDELDPSALAKVEALTTEQLVNLLDLPEPVSDLPSLPVGEQSNALGKIGSIDEVYQPANAGVDVRKSGHAATKHGPFWSDQSLIARARTLAERFASRWTSWSKLESAIAQAKRSIWDPAFVTSSRGTDACVINSKGWTRIDAKQLTVQQILDEPTTYAHLLTKRVDYVGSMVDAGVGFDVSGVSQSLSNFIVVLQRDAQGAYRVVTAYPRK